MQINRADFLRALEQVKPSLLKDTSQRSCALFIDDRIVAYNGQYMIVVPFVTGFTGAVHAEELLSVLAKLTAETVDISVQDGRVLIKANRARLGVRFEDKIDVPIWDVLHSYDCVRENMLEMPSDILSAFKRAHFCASKDAHDGCLFGLHVKEGVVSATDKYRAIRIRCESETARRLPEFILPAFCVKILTKFAITRIGIQDAWAFFADDSGLLFCVRLFAEGSTFPDMSSWFQRSGTDLFLPTELVPALDKALVFTKVQPADVGSSVTITIKPNRIVLYGEGSLGWYEETIQAKNEVSKPVKFSINPELLRDIVPHVQRATLGDVVIIFVGDDFEYVAALYASQEDSGDNKE